MGEPDDKNKGGGSGDEKKFTQADVDRIVTERLAREKASHKEELKKFADYETIKAENVKLKADIAAKDGAEKTELEKLRGDFEARISELEAQNKTLADEKAARDLQKLKVDRAKAGNYPEIYAEAASGSTPEEIDASLKSLYGRYGDRNFGAGGGDGDGNSQKFTRGQIKAMTPEEYEKNETAILDAMAKGEIK